MTESVAGAEPLGGAHQKPKRSLRIIFLLPALLFLVVGGFFLWGLDPARNPSEIPSALIGTPVPEFDLPPVQGRTLGLRTTDLKGDVSLVNIFASWCIACRYEHPLFIRLKAEEIVPIHGLNYRDAPDDAAEWLETLGDPYTRTGADRNGRVSIEWGVYGVPETFVIDREGRIVYKHIGAVTPEVLHKTLLPLIERLQQWEN